MHYSIDEQLEQNTTEILKEEQNNTACSTVLSPIEESDGSVSSHISYHDEVEKDSIPKLTDDDVLRIIEDIKKGDYDNNIRELWKTVDMTQYDVKNHSVSLSSSSHA